jgi:hypothetical protein
MAVVRLVSEIAHHLEGVGVVFALELPQQSLALIAAAIRERPVRLALGQAIHNIECVE